MYGSQWDGRSRHPVVRQNRTKLYTIFSETYKEGAMMNASRKGRLFKIIYGKIYQTYGVRTKVAQAIAIPSAQTAK